MEILGAILKAIFSPIIKLIFLAFYGVLVRGPLRILNTETKVLDYATGSYTDKLLFDTSLTEGKANLNFFSSDSPLRMPFLIMIGIAAALVALGFGFAIAHSLTKSRRERGDSPLRRTGRLVLAAGGVFTLPVIFLSVLSLVGALLGALNGQSPNISQTNVTVYQSTTRQQINQIKNASINTQSQNSANPFDRASTIRNGSMFGPSITNTASSVIDFSDVNLTKTVSAIYDDLSKATSPYTNIPSEVATLAQQSSALYNEAIDLIVEKSINSNEITLKPDLREALDKSNEIIETLSPNRHNDTEADVVKDAVTKLGQINNAIGNWNESVKAIFQYMPADTPGAVGLVGTSFHAAMTNLQTAYKIVWGNEQDLSNTSAVTNLQTLAYSITNLINGSAESPSSGLWSLRNMLSVFPDSSLVVTFYQVVTNNRDANWDQTFNSIPNGSAMLLIGFVMILGAIVILALIIIEAFVRVGVLGLLFVISPVIVGATIFDDGQRFKTWVNVVIGQLVSIAGVILLVRLGAVLTTRFASLLDSAPQFAGDGGYLTRSIMLALFAYAVLMAAYRSKDLIASLSGAGQGILGALQGLSTLRMIGGAAKIGAIGAIAASGRLSGLSSAKRLATSASAGAAGAAGGATPLSRSGALRQVWGNRNPVKHAGNALASLSAGKYGTIAGKERVISKTLAKQDSRANRFQQKAARPASLAARRQELEASRQKNKESRQGFKGFKDSNKGGK